MLSRLGRRSLGLRFFTETKLFTPGPLTTSAATRAEMQHDYGSRDPKFLRVVEEVRDGLLDIGHVSRAAGYECVIMQGSGTMGVEAMIGSVVPKDGFVLILVNGKYGARQASICKYLGIRHATTEVADTSSIGVAELEAALAAHPEATHVSMIHHETTGGVLNPVAEVGSWLAKHRPDVPLMVDSMSAFGAYDVDMVASNVSYLVSSANKCIEGVPGFSFVLAHRARLLAAEGSARSLSFDLQDQLRGVEATGQFRFTPPTHALAAFRQALREHAEEGGVAARRRRYEENTRIVMEGMTRLGFRSPIDEGVRGCIIHTFFQPSDPNWKFESFYDQLAAKGCVIYPGGTTSGGPPTFRLGTIGRVFPEDCAHLVRSVEEVLAAMAVKTPVQ